MKKTVSSIVVAMALTIFVASAFAVSNRQVGKIVGDKGAKVKLTAIKEDGRTVALDRVRINKVTPVCRNGSTTETVSLVMPSAVEVFTDRGFKIRYEVGPTSKAVFQGTVNRNGRRVKGTIKTGFFSSGGGECKIPKSVFKTRQPVSKVL